MEQDFDLLRNSGIAQDVAEISKNNTTYLLPPRELRITLEPISSVIVSFEYPGSRNGRDLELISNLIHCEPNQTIELLNCNRGISPYHYRGRTVTEIRPLGAIGGKYMQQVQVQALSKGDLFGCRLLHGDIPGATIKVELFDNRWKVVIFEKITSSFIQHTIRW